MSIMVPSSNLLFIQKILVFKCQFAQHFSSVYPPKPHFCSRSW